MNGTYLHIYVANIQANGGSAECRKIGGLTIILPSNSNCLASGKIGGSNGIGKLGGL